MRSMFLAPLFGLALSLGGCVVYDNDCPDDMHMGGGGAEAEDPAYWLTPDIASPGDTFIGSLESDQAVNFEAIADIQFYGDVSICTSQARDEELILTVAVGVDASPGPVDALIVMENGTRVLVTEILVIDGIDGGDDGAGEEGSEDNSDGDEDAPDEETGTEDDGSADDDATEDDGDSSIGGC